MFVRVSGRAVAVDADCACLIVGKRAYICWSSGRPSVMTRALGGEPQLLYRIIAGATEGEEVDHVNRDRLDNRKSNLRKCTRQENACNRGKAKHNKSGYKGVYWCKGRRKYRAQIQARGKHRLLGQFDVAQDAARAYDNAAKELHGEFAVTNESLGLL